MLDSETVITHTRGASAVSVAMRDEGVTLVLLFADLSGEGEVLEVRVLPDAAAVSPQVMARIGKRFSVYSQYARSALRWDKDDVVSNLRALRSLGRTSRGLPHDHYIQVARVYSNLVAEGSPHPVKALGEMFQTDISNASRWIKEARRRELI